MRKGYLFKDLSQAKLKLGWFFLLILVVVALDLFTKEIVDTYLEYAQVITILPVFNITLVYNHGAAFSFLANAGGWQQWLFLAISLIACVFFLIWLLRLKANQKILAWALSLLLAGAMGNFIDRLINGYVVDFLSFHWQQHYFPAFNVADSAITIGVVFLLIDTFFVSKSK